MQEIRWLPCPGCSIMLTTVSLKKHKCHPKVREIKDAAWDEFVEEELGNIEDELATFFNTNEAKFMEFLAERERGLES